MNYQFLINGAIIFDFLPTFGVTSWQGNYTTQTSNKVVLPFNGNYDILSQKHLAPPTEPKLLVTGVLNMALLGQLIGLTCIPQRISVLGLHDSHYNVNLDFSP